MELHRDLRQRRVSVATRLAATVGALLAASHPAAALVLETNGPLRQVGFDREVTVVAHVSGVPPDAEVGYRWEQVGGPDVSASLVGANTATLRLRTPPLDRFVPEPIRAGVIPIPAAAAIPIRVRVTATVGGREVAGETLVQAAYATAGTRGVATDTVVHLAGHAGQSEWHWTLRSRSGTPGVTSAIEGEHSRFATVRTYLPDDVTAREELSGLEVRLHGDDWDRFEPCGRCHATEQTLWAGSRHATVLERGLRGLLGPDYREECLECHALGYQPGVSNGGFDDVALQARWRFPSELGSESAALPAKLQRLAGVTCLSCHGPGRFTPARLDTGMCARCHDRPPRYTSVAQWRRTAKSRFDPPVDDDHPAVRAECTRCHSAQGFVAWTAGRAHRSAPSAAEAQPITCAACHDPHDPRKPAQLRVYGATTLPSGRRVPHAGAGALCMACHNSASRRGEGMPDAPQAAVLTGGLAWTPMATSIHEGLRGTCVACHEAHEWKATVPCDARSCAGSGCHEDGPECGTGLRGEVEVALRTLRPAADSDEEAARLLEMVRRDGSGGAHNPAWTRAVLERVRARLGGRP